jgi:hypothetical protein
MLDRVTMNSESLSTMLLRLRQLSASASTHKPDLEESQGIPGPTALQAQISKAFEGWDYLVLETSDGSEYRLYSTLPLRTYLSERQIELLNDKIRTEKLKIEEINHKKSFLKSTITTTPELSALETALEIQIGLKVQDDDPRRNGLYMKWTGRDPMYFEAWDSPADGISKYNYLTSKSRPSLLPQRQRETDERRTKRQRDLNYLVIQKVYKQVPEYDFSEEKEALRRYETPESYEWWSWNWKTVRECPLDEGQSYFKDIQVHPQLLYHVRHEKSEYWSYADALQLRKNTLDAAEKDRRLQLQEQSVFWAQYKETYPNL